jgi:ribosomal protein S18 acetylase RimI-like enzyme
VIEIVVAPEDTKETLWEMFQDYAKELSEYDGEKRRAGSYHYPCFDLYWSDPKRTPFILLSDHEPAGFCLLQDVGVCYRIDEFYIRPLHRRRGFGKKLVDHIKNHCRSLGRHTVLAANVYVNNEPAIRFWLSAGFVDTGRRTRIRNLRLIEMETELRSQRQSD